MRYPLSGTVIGALLNHAPSLAALGEAASAAPYKAAPKAPVLCVRPRNTLALNDSPLNLPAGEAALEVSAQLGLVIGQTAFQLSLANALDYVAGYVCALDASLPQPSFYRPNARLKMRDGYCLLGNFVAKSAVTKLDNLQLSLSIDGQLANTFNTADLIRSAAQLLVDVSEFMTLNAGDVLLLGAPFGAGHTPLAGLGQSISATVAGAADFGEVNSLVSQNTAPLLRFTETSALPSSTKISARVIHNGEITSAYPAAEAGQIRLASGAVLPEGELRFLPPFAPRTIIALGLNYADHVKELAKELTVSAKDEPLVFFKTISSVTAHGSATPRPPEVSFMHYECELAVVIGRTAQNVKAGDALQYVAGYTVCNDYAVRDYLENWYRPNLRVKNRNGGTALGPWFVPAALLKNPQDLWLKTFVNGAQTQSGHTSNMVNTVAQLIEYLSSFMTLEVGDVILTGTPEGVINIKAGDVVECEIEGLGRLKNIMVGGFKFEVQRLIK